MSYQKTIWVKGDIVTADKLNKIEDQLEDNTNNIVTFENRLTYLEEHSPNPVEEAYLRDRVDVLDKLKHYQKVELTKNPIITFTEADHGMNHNFTSYYPFNTVNIWRNDNLSFMYAVDGAVPPNLRSNVTLNTDTADDYLYLHFYQFNSGASYNQTFRIQKDGTIFNNFVLGDNKLRVQFFLDDIYYDYEGTDTAEYILACAEYSGEKKEVALSNDELPGIDHVIYFNENAYIDYNAINRVFIVEGLDIYTIYKLTDDLNIITNQLENHINSQSEINNRVESNLFERKALTPASNIIIKKGTILDFSSWEGGNYLGSPRYVTNSNSSGTYFPAVSENSGGKLLFRYNGSDSFELLGDFQKPWVEDTQNDYIIWDKKKKWLTYIGEEESIFNAGNVNFNTAPRRIDVINRRNIQADWNQTSVTADDYIKNKPEVYNKTEIDLMLGDIESALDAILGG